MGSTPNLQSVRSKLEFAKSTRTTGVMDRRLHDDIRQFGIDAFAFEVLEVLEGLDCGHRSDSVLSQAIRRIRQGGERTC